MFISAYERVQVGWDSASCQDQPGECGLTWSFTVPGLRKLNLCRGQWVCVFTVVWFEEIKSLYHTHTLSQQLHTHTHTHTHARTHLNREEKENTNTLVFSMTSFIISQVNSWKLVKVPCCWKLSHPRRLSLNTFYLLHRVLLSCQTVKMNWLGLWVAPWSP